MSCLLPFIMVTRVPGQKKEKNSCGATNAVEPTCEHKKKSRLISHKNAKKNKRIRKNCYIGKYLNYSKIVCILFTYMRLYFFFHVDIYVFCAYMENACSDA